MEGRVCRDARVSRELGLKPPPTMADVARLAGVSAMTVSRALRRDAAVSSGTRARVLEVIDEIGYVPDHAAGALSSGRSGLVGAILPTLTIPLFAYVAKGLGDTILQSGYELQIATSDYSAEREEALIKSLLRRRPEALMLAGVDHTGRAARLLGDVGIPVIEFLDGGDPPIDNLLSLDLVAVARATVDYLAGKGRRRLAIVASSDEADRRAARRVDALRSAALEHGLDQPLAIFQGSPIRPAEQGARGAAQAIARDPEIDAIVFMNDYAAIGGISALEKAGMNVPSDVAVFGFGDCEVARYVRPALTTISFNPVAAGVEVGKIVLSTLEASRQGRERNRLKLTLDFQVLERDSA